MPRPAKQNPLIAMLRGSRRLAAVVLTLFLASVATSAVCAAHDLADAGIGAPTAQACADDVPSPASGDNPSQAGAEHCCHSGGHHSVAVLADFIFHMPDPQSSVNPTDTTFGPSTAPQRELRPPIL